MRRNIRRCDVYICICNALTDRRVKQALEEADRATPGAVYAACGCRAQCGRCVRAVLDLLREQAGVSDPALQAAD